MTEPTNELAELREEIDRLKAKDQIRQQIVRYARALDWLDPELLREVHHEDAYLDFGFFKGTFADYCPMVMELEGSKDVTFHMCNTIQIELKGDSAEVESYGIAAAREGELTTIFGGRYLDSFERRDSGVWKIARRVFVLDWNLEHRGVDSLEEALAGLNFVTGRSVAHPLYRCLGVDVA
jgi:hypothetical protein